MPTRSKFAAVVVLILSMLFTINPTTAGASNQHGSLVLLFGRTMNKLCSVDTSKALPQQIPLTSVAPRIKKLGGTAAGNIVLDRVSNYAGFCAKNQDREYATWSQISNLRTKFGWTFQSAGAHREATKESDAELKQDACGSAATLEAKGFPQTQYAYPNGAEDSRTQAIVSTCYPLARTYTNPGIAYNTEAAVDANNGLALTYTVNGLPIPYTSVDKLTEAMEAPAGEIAEVQVYMLVTGDYTSASGSQYWHCGVNEVHYTYADEVYCGVDYFKALRNAVAAGVKIIDLPTAAKMLGE